MSNPKQPEALRQEIAALRRRVDVLETQVHAWEAFAQEVVSVAHDAEASADVRLASTFLRILGQHARAILS